MISNRFLADQAITGRPAEKCNEAFYYCPECGKRIVAGSVEQQTMHCFQCGPQLTTGCGERYTLTYCPATGCKVMWMDMECYITEFLTEAPTTPPPKEDE